MLVFVLCLFGRAQTQHSSLVIKQLAHWPSKVDMHVPLFFDIGYIGSLPPESSTELPRDVLPKDCQSTM